MIDFYLFSFSIKRTINVSGRCLFKEGGDVVSYMFVILMLATAGILRVFRSPLVLSQNPLLSFTMLSCFVNATMLVSCIFMPERNNLLSDESPNYDGFDTLSIKASENQVYLMVNGRLVAERMTKRPKNLAFFSRGSPAYNKCPRTQMIVVIAKINWKSESTILLRYVPM